LRRWFEDPREEMCPRCGKERQQTMAYILNECTRNYSLMTRRHNKLANVVRRGIERFLAGDLRSTIHENQEIRQDGIPNDLARLRPDMVFERQRSRSIADVRFSSTEDEVEHEKEEQVTEIIEFSCPYGYISQGRNTLERVYEEKKRKYTELARNLKRLRKGQARVTAVIVSSMGAEAETETEAEVGNVVEVEVGAEVEDRRERNLEEHIGAEPGWRGRRRRGGRGRVRERRRRKQPVIGKGQQIPEIDEVLQLESQDTRMEGIETMENPADDEESTADDTWI
jgi:hypothetical protein